MHGTGRTIIRKFDPENVGVAVGILSLEFCRSRIRDMPITLASPEDTRPLTPTPETQQPMSWRNITSWTGVVTLKLK